MTAMAPATVGVIKPVRESASHAQLERIMPAGVAFESIYLGIKYRLVAEFRAVMAAYDEKVPEMASRGVDLLHPEGAPPFMLEGLDGEKRRSAAWEEQFGHSCLHHRHDSACRHGGPRDPEICRHHTVLR